VEAADVNGDGIVDLKEFVPAMLALLAAVKGENPTRPVKVDASSEGQLASQLRDWFESVEEAVGDNSSISGGVSPFALASALSNSGLQLAPSAILQLVTEADADHNGLIDFDEFHTLMLDLLQDPPEDTLNVSDFSQAELEQYFAELFAIGDANGDGVLESEEFKALLQHCGFEFSPEVAQQLFRVADVNRDGVVEYEEFLPMIASLAKQVAVQASDEVQGESRAQQEYELQQRFLLADANGDGVLEPQEFIDLLTRSDLPRIPPAVILELFGRLDTNRDGLIQYEEYLPMMSELIADARY